MFIVKNDEISAVSISDENLTRERQTSLELDGATPHNNELPCDLLENIFGDKW